MCRVSPQLDGQHYTLWDAFVVEGRRGNQQEMTLGDLLQHVKVRLPRKTLTLPPPPPLHTFSVNETFVKQENKTHLKKGSNIELQ